MYLKLKVTRANYIKQFSHFHSVLLAQRAHPPLKPSPSPTKILLGKLTLKTAKEHSLFNQNIIYTYENYFLNQFM